MRFPSRSPLKSNFAMFQDLSDLARFLLMRWCSLSFTSHEQIMYSTLQRNHMHTVCHATTLLSETGSHFLFVILQRCRVSTSAKDRPLFLLILNCNRPSCVEMPDIKLSDCHEIHHSRLTAASSIWLTDSFTSIGGGCVCVLSLIHI